MFLNLFHFYVFLLPTSGTNESVVWIESWQLLNGLQFSRAQWERNQLDYLEQSPDSEDNKIAMISFYWLIMMTMKMDEKHDTQMKMESRMLKTCQLTINIGTAYLERTD